MTKKRRIAPATPAAAALIALIAGFGGLGCLVSAFGLPVNMTWVLMACAAAAAVGGAACIVSWGWIPVILASVGAVGAFYHWGSLAREAEAFVWHLTSWYDMGYGWGTVSWSGQALTGQSMSGLFACLGFCFTVLLALEIGMNSGAFFQMLLGLLPLLPCFLLTDTMPGKLWLWMLLAGMIAVLLTSRLRRWSPGQADALALRLLIPALLAVGLLLQIPEDAPERTAAFFEEIRDSAAEKAMSLYEKLTQIPEPGEEPEEDPTIVPAQTAPPEELIPAVIQKREDLKDAGANPRLNIPALYVTAEQTQPLYLRGAILGIYTGTGWEQSPSMPAGDDFWGWEMKTDSRETTERVTVETIRREKLLYCPYDLAEGSLSGTSMDSDCYVPNSENVRRYSFSRVESDPSYGDAVLPEAQRRVYTSLPDDFDYERMAPFLRAALDGVNTADSRAVAEAIGSFVRRSAAYDLYPESMEGEDFALWFLESADRGYCIHFATTAAVMLRSAGVPARYVTGYLVQTRGNQTVLATSNDAHAWVEYFADGQGWLVLEATPGDDSAEPRLPENSTEPTYPDSDPEQITGPVRPTHPAEQDPADEQEAEPEKDTPDLRLLWLLLIPGAVGAMALRRSIIRSRRGTRRRDPNREALRLWACQERLSTQTGVPTDLRAEELAKKARFSQHLLTADELAVLRDGLKTQHYAVRKLPLWKRFVIRWILVLD